MVNPVRALAKFFARRSPMTLLSVGIAISLLDWLFLFKAAAREGVLHIDKGVGLLSNHGLLSAIFCNAVFLYLGKKYYTAVFLIKDSRGVLDVAPIEKSLSALASEIEMRGKNTIFIYLPMIVGALAWLSNVSSHVLGNPEVRWGHKVFDSLEHPLTFTASRLHNIYTWVVVLPFMVYVIVITSDHLWKLVAEAKRGNFLKYDLLNPDQRGGFLFIDKAAIAFNVLVVLIYIQITLHIETFKVNSDHIAAYVLATVLLVAVNRMFFSRIYSNISVLRIDALNKVKDSVFKGDAIGLDVLKYCYEKRLSMSTVLNFAINPGAVVVSGVIKLWPLILKALN